MISLDFAWSIFIFVGIPVIVIAIQWLLAQKEKFSKNCLLDEQKFVSCRICTYAYFISQDKGGFSKCPRCQSLNKRQDNKKLV